VFAGPYRRELLDTLLQAERAAAHRFHFFGREFQAGGDVAWHSDPVSGATWPQVFHADVPVHGGDVGYGDVKYVWELNRQQYLIDLGKAFFLTGDEAHRTAIRELVRSWIKGNPYAMGVNWACALEPAFRSLSWLWAYYLTLPDLDEAFHLEWLGSFFDHARFLERHLEEYSSPFNHLIGEAAALYMLGACFPEFAAAPRWRARARTVLEGRLDDQFYPDGGSVEQSTFYHHATVGYYLLAALAARAIDEDLSPRVWNAIERGLEFSLHLLQPDGKTPEIGGADDGKPIRMEQLPLWDFRPYLAIGAVLFRRGDFKWAAGRFHEDALWLLGPGGAEAFESIQAARPAEASTRLEQSGYWVMRSDWARDADYVCVDCGEQAAGIRHDSVPNSMHGHADCLSLVAWLGGRRILVDSGFYAYNCGGEWEAHFRETAAHNTARVDGRDQARHLGKMAWSHGYRATQEQWRAEPAQVWGVGSHDGFGRGASPVTHRRAVWLRAGGCLVIYDEFVSRGEHNFEVNYQFAPGTLTGIAGHGALFDGAVDVVWTGSASWTAEFCHGGPTPADGWIAPSLGILQAAPRLTLRCLSGRPRTTLLTVLAARGAGAPRVIACKPSPDHATPSLVAVSGPEGVDWITAAEMPADGPIDTDALVCICRVRDGQVVTVDRIGGTRVAVDVARFPACEPAGGWASGPPT
jgi:hypothetical protein